MDLKIDNMLYRSYIVILIIQTIVYFVSLNVIYFAEQVVDIHILINIVMLCNQKLLPLIMYAIGVLVLSKYSLYTNRFGIMIILFSTVVSILVIMYFKTINNCFSGLLTSIYYSHFAVYLRLLFILIYLFVNVFRAINCSNMVNRINNSVDENTDKPNKKQMNDKYSISQIVVWRSAIIRVFIILATWLLLIYANMVITSIARYDTKLTEEVHVAYEFVLLPSIYYLSVASLCIWTIYYIIRKIKKNERTGNELN